MTDDRLPRWSSVLVVVAHPDDESFGLGGVIDSFVAAGARVQVVSLTRGEASTLGEDSQDLAVVRTAEFEAATASLGVDRAVALDFPDGGLAEVPLDRLVQEVATLVEPADGVLAFDSGGITGHPDHIRATDVADVLAREWGRGLLGLTLPDRVARQLHEETGEVYLGHGEAEIDISVVVRRDAQLAASAAHASQAVPGSALWRRLELQGSRDALRWLVRPVG